VGADIARATSYEHPHSSKDASGGCVVLSCGFAVVHPRYLRRFACSLFGAGASPT